MSLLSPSSCELLHCIHVGMHGYCTYTIEMNAYELPCTDSNARPGRFVALTCQCVKFIARKPWLGYLILTVAMMATTQPVARLAFGAKDGEQNHQEYWSGCFVVNSL